MVVMPPAAVSSWLRHRAETPEPVQIGAFEHAFLIHISAQEAGAVGLKMANHFFGREVRCFAPAVRDHLAGLGIERDHQPARPRGVGDFGKFLPIECRRSDDHAIRALFNQRPRAFG